VLTELLQRVAGGGVHSVAGLAREFDVSEELLKQMTADLLRMGYLGPVSDGCGERCDACPAAGGCSIARPSSVWALTEKGMRAANGK
jgi:hypothetical protein